jgi:hypothetical protein
MIGFRVDEPSDVCTVHWEVCPNTCVFLSYLLESVAQL